MAVQLMKKGFAVGTLVDRLRMKEPVDQTAVSDKLNTARCDVSEAETILDEVYTATTRLSIYWFVISVSLYFGLVFLYFH